MANKLHKEKQRYTDKMVFGMLGAGVLLVLAGVCKAAVSDSFNPLHFSLLLTVAAGLSGWMYWLFRLRLSVKITDKSIKYKMAPLHGSSRKIPWSEVEDCTIVQTPKIGQWHGGNLTYGAESHYSLSGRNGLSVKTRDGRKYFIGCRDVEGLKDALSTFSSKQVSA